MSGRRGVAAPIVKALRWAFDDTMQEPGFIEKMQAAKVQFNPIGGEERTTPTMIAPMSFALSNAVAAGGLKGAQSSASRRRRRKVEAARGRAQVGTE